MYKSTWTLGIAGFYVHPTPKQPVYNVSPSSDVTHNGGFVLQTRRTRLRSLPVTWHPKHTPLHLRIARNLDQPRDSSSCLIKSLLRTPEAIPLRPNARARTSNGPLSQNVASNISTNCSASFVQGLCVEGCATKAARASLSLLCHWTGFTSA